MPPAGPRPAQPRRRTRRLALGVGLLLAGAAAGQVQPAPGPGPVVSDAANLQSASALELLSTLADPAASQAARDRAAERLITTADRPDVFEALRVQFSAAAANSPVCSTLLRVIAATPAPSAALYGPVAEFISRAPADQLPSMLPAIASWRTREALRFLFKYTDDAQPAPVRDAAFQSLVRLAGHENFNTDSARWAAFIDRAATLSEEEWTAELIAGLAARADALAARQSVALARTADTLRKLYLATPVEQRSDFLASLLLDDLEQARSLGFELASRELSSTRRLSSAVSDACLTLLHNPSARVRYNAATLLSRLSPAEAGPAIAAALAVETDPLAAGAMLAASVRWPTPTITPFAVNWLKRSPQTRGPAAQAALALARAGHLYGSPARDQILDVLRGQELTELPPAAGPLLTILGDDEDRARAARLLQAADPALRSATADAAVVYADMLPALIEAAAHDPQLWEPCVRATTMHEATAEGFLALARLPAPSADARRDGLEFLASVMPATENLAAAEQLPAGDPLRELVLAPLTDPARLASLRSFSGLPLNTPAYEATIKGIIMLASLRLTNHRPEDALLALDAIPPADDRAHHAVLARLRAQTMLALNRLGPAADAGASADDWLDAIDSLSDREHAPEMLETFVEQFPALTPAQQLRLDTLRARLSDTQPRGDATQDPPR